VSAPIRQFETGATRNVDAGKPDFEGFLSPLSLRRYAEYMHRNRVQADGSVRASDNWQKGIPLDSYAKSGFRHFMSFWSLHRGFEADESLEDALCALIFNAQGYLHEILKRPPLPKVITHQLAAEIMRARGEADDPAPHDGRIGQKPSDDAE
jgi:hypothetical protein